MSATSRWKAAGAHPLNHPNRLQLDLALE
jgi:hypothetical protein